MSDPAGQSSQRGTLIVGGDAAAAEALVPALPAAKPPAAGVTVGDGTVPMLDRDAAVLPLVAAAVAPGAAAEIAEPPLLAGAAAPKLGVGADGVELALVLVTVAPGDEADVVDAVDVA